MQMVYDLVEPQLLIDYVRQWDQEVNRPEFNQTLVNYFPERRTDDLEFRVRKGALNDVDIAEYRSWDTPAPMTGRPGTKYIRGKLGPVSRQIPLGEEEYLQQQSLQRNTDDPIINAIYDDAERMIRSVQNRLEVARGDLFNDGVLTLSENGLSLEANWGRPAAMSVTAGTVWTDAGAPILTNLLAWQEAYSDENGVDPGALVIPRKRIGSFALNTEMRNYSASNGTVPLRLNRALINQALDAEGLPPIVVFDRQVRKDGVKTRVLPENKVFLAPPVGEKIGDTMYGITAEALKLRRLGLIEADAMPGVVAVVTTNDHPVQTYTVGTAISMPVMPNAGLVMDAVVAA